MRRIGRPPVYSTLLERIVANSTQPEDNPCACWTWTGPTRGTRGSRPAMSMRRPGKAHPVTVDPLRLLLDCGPHEEASHLCADNFLCVNPDHALPESKQDNIRRRDGLHVPIRPRAPIEHDDPDWRAGVHTDNVCPF